MSGMGSHQGATSTKDEWLTPPYILKTLGDFDLDPCAPVVSNRPWNTAAEHFTIEDDGLNLPWYGRVWMNPPYGKKASAWIQRLAKHNNGIALLFARTETELFVNEVWGKASALLFLYNRITFFNSDGTRGVFNGGAPSVLISYGENNIDPLKNSGLPGAFIKEWTR